MPLSHAAVAIHNRHDSIVPKCHAAATLRAGLGWMKCERMKRSEDLAREWKVSGTKEDQAVPMPHTGKESARENRNEGAAGSVETEDALKSRREQRWPKDRGGKNSTATYCSPPLLCPRSRSLLMEHASLQAALCHTRHSGHKGKHNMSDMSLCRHNVTQPAARNTFQSPI